MLITEARAQAAEATQAAIQAADILLQYKVLGAVCVLLLITVGLLSLVIRHLYNDLKAVNATTLADRERLIKALEGVSDSDDRTKEVLQQIRSTLETRGQALGDLSNQVGLTAQEARHGFNNLSQAASGIVEMLREMARTAAARVGGGA